MWFYSENGIQGGCYFLLYRAPCQYNLLLIEKKILRNGEYFKCFRKYRTLWPLMTRIRDKINTLEMFYVRSIS